jgi:ABC-type glycerol-3-phosphate transport system substrate-binding protein
MSIAAAGWSYGIPANVKHPYESWLLIKFLTTTESAKTFAFEQGRPSPVVKFNQDKRYFDKNPFWNVIGESLNRSVVATPHPLASRFADADKKYYGQLLAGTESPDNVLNKLQAEINTAISEYKAGR